MAEEIFQSGILPSDSDFRIFRDFGNIAGELMSHMRWGLITVGFSIGLDMAQVDNGYVYHTAFDTFENVPGRSIQNSGNNVLGCPVTNRWIRLYRYGKHVPGYSQCDRQTHFKEFPE